MMSRSSAASGRASRTAVPGVASRFFRKTPADSRSRLSKPVRRDDNARKSSTENDWARGEARNAGASSAIAARNARRPTVIMDGHSSDVDARNREHDRPVHASPLTFAIATEKDAASIAALRTAVAGHLTRTFGQGHWSGTVTERGVRYGLKTSRILVARRGSEIVATM